MPGVKTGIFCGTLFVGVLEKRIRHAAYSQNITPPSRALLRLLSLAAAMILTACSGDHAEYSSFTPSARGTLHLPWAVALNITSSLPGISGATTHNNRQPPASDPAEASDTQTQPAKLTVLYIEDNPLELAVMRQIFAKSKHLTLLNSRTGEYGIKLAITHSPTLILLDMTLPGINGAEVLRRLRNHPETSTIPVVAITRNSNALGMPLDLAGFDDYLTKPVSAARLQAVLNRRIVDLGPTLTSQAD